MSSSLSGNASCKNAGYTPLNLVLFYSRIQSFVILKWQKESNQASCASIFFYFSISCLDWNKNKDIIQKYNKFLNLLLLSNRLVYIILYIMLNHRCFKWLRRITNYLSIKKINDVINCCKLIYIMGWWVGWSFYHLQNYPG